MQPIRTHLNLLVDKDTIYKMLAVGSEFDVNKNGLFDARSGCVNVWCSPDDKPDCWDIPITKGGLHYPREYVGGIHWEWDEKTDKFSIFIEAVPYNLERHYKKVSPKQLQSCLDWVEVQAKNLLRLAHIQETVLGICCPFCDYVLPNDELLNTLI